MIRRPEKKRHCFDLPLEWIPVPHDADDDAIEDEDGFRGVPALAIKAHLDFFGMSKEEDIMRSPYLMKALNVNDKNKTNMTS